MRCWLDPKASAIGKITDTDVDQSLRRYDQLLLVLSNYALQSAWVPQEVKTAFEHGSQRERRVLFPIRLDDTIMQIPEAWAADLRHLRIEDFRNWTQQEKYQEALSRLFSNLTARTH